jgi:hypothetical protein
MNKLEDEKPFTEESSAPDEHDEPGEPDELSPLLNRAKHDAAAAFAGVVIGQLAGIRAGTPLVLYPGQPGTAAVAARSTIDLHGAHVGKALVLMFEQADPGSPIVVGVLRPADAATQAPGTGLVEIDCDGDRLIVAAKDQLVLRCGSASITLTKEGRIVLRGTHLSSDSTGVNRIKGGSIQLN